MRDPETTVAEHIASEAYQERLVRDDELTCRIQAGYSKPTPTPTNLKPRIIDGDLNDDAQIAAQELHENYKRLCNKQSNIFYERYRTSPHVGFDDLQQEAFFGLLHAALKWSPEKNIAFYTHASSMIRNYLNRYAEEQESTIRVPLHAKETIRQYGRKIYWLYQSGETMPRMSRIADAMGISHEEVDRVAIWEAATLQMGSLDGGFFQDNRDRRSTYGTGEASWHAAIPGSSETQTVENEILLSALIDIVHQALNPGEADLTERQVAILKLHFFGRGDGPLTLEEIASEYGVTPERIRQVEVQAIRKLRGDPKMAKKLRNLLT